MNNQAKVILSSFMFFAMDIQDKEITPKQKKYFRMLGWTSAKYQHKVKEVEDKVNDILKSINKTIDLMLLSVSILAEYYEQMRGKKRLFTPMSYKEIVDVQDECLEVVSKEVANDTFDVCEILVKGLLNENK